MCGLAAHQCITLLYNRKIRSKIVTIGRINCFMTTTRFSGGFWRNYPVMRCLLILHSFQIAGGGIVQQLAVL